MNILDSINNTEDLRSVRAEDIPRLCSEIRSFLIDSVSKTGGHLASSLGAVEITVALHRVYDPQKDRILFDVGHQAYVHKLLTGRKNRFPTLRQYGGLSGFPRPEESDADPFIAGHASDSVSVAVGMARARTLRGEDYDVVAVIGDGSLTGGLCFEGLSDAGESREPIVIILNDNGMSINRSVGGISQLLSRARMRPGYVRFKKAYRRLMRNLPGLYFRLHRIKERIKKDLLPQGGIFADLGFEYLGPIDGHDEAAMETAIRWARRQHGPVLIHAVTEKGKGYAPAEAYPELYHGVGAFDPAVGVLQSEEDDFSSRFGAAAVRMAEKDPTVCAVTAAMEKGTGLGEFASRFPERYFELGIVEEHAVAMCAGMARQGMKPVFAVYSTFLQRSYDMLIEDVGLTQEHVVFAVDRAGIVGRDGITHQGSFDIAYLSTVPGMKIYAPSGFAELESMLEIALEEETGPVALRYPRGSEGRFRDDHSRESVSVLREGEDVTIVCHGITVNDVLDAADMLDREDIHVQVIKVNRILPLDTALCLDSLRKTGKLIVVEDACRTGGVGAHILAAAAESGVMLKRTAMLDLGTGVVGHGTTQRLHHELGMDPEGICRTAKEMMDEKDQARSADF